jgi:hypothetical protein
VCTVMLVKQGRCPLEFKTKQQAGTVGAPECAECGDDAPGRFHVSMCVLITCTHQLFV